jgi:ribonuclease HI
VKTRGGGPREGAKVSCITINTDASFHPRYKVGGYAFYIVCDLFKIKKSGKFKKELTGSMDAEMMSIGNALHTLLYQKGAPKSKYLIINTDCQYAITAIKKQSTPLGKEIYKIWNKVILKVGSTNNEIRHVKAHSGVDDKRSKVNEWCDTEAKKWMRESVQNKINNNEKENSCKNKVQQKKH